MTFGSGHSSTVPQADTDRHYFSVGGLESQCRPRSIQQIHLGEPLLLTWTLTNKSNKPIPVPNDIRIEGLYSHITVINPHGVVRPMPTFTIECERTKIDNLEPGEEFDGADPSSSGAHDGFAFERAGRHLDRRRRHVGNFRGAVRSQRPNRCLGELSAIGRG